MGNDVPIYVDVEDVEIAFFSEHIFCRCCKCVSNEISVECERAAERLVLNSSPTFGGLQGFGSRPVSSPELRPGPPH